MTKAFVFPGQGAQTIGMGKALADAYPAARAVFDEVDEALGENLSALIWEGDQDALTLTQNAQPALMATSLAALRALEAEALRGRHSDLVLRASEEVAVYLLNRKRIELAELEELYGVTIITRPDDSLIGPNFEIDAGGPPPSKKVEMVALPPLVKIVEDGDADE